MDFKQAQTLIDLKKMIEDYVNKYNNHRYQWTLNKMTPVQYRIHLLSA
ncbi:IS3 family transposase [Jeotgalibacillus marinus]|uniref:IS3 family transposase n=1 Tax=Jeotgalibacillus marinus TaxID=86667 RepID=A0ABV3Q1J4_9BACL